MLQRSIAQSTEGGRPPHWKRGPHPWISILEDGLYAQTYPTTVHDEELLTFVAAVEHMIGSRFEPYAWIIAVDGLLHTNAAQRKHIADHVTRMQAHDARYCAGGGIVAATAFARGLVTAVFWLSPLPYPYRILGSIAEAESYAIDQLRLRR
ncbi:MAG: hypothetical protein KC776_40665 [Myxococcales bacterium]|nr:hypothetical protein [Myxococcales bacterium]MCB9582599.1 hypothetical protein [Polyangiaceae bacterium]